MGITQGSATCHHLVWSLKQFSKVAVSQSTCDYSNAPISCQVAEMYCIYYIYVFIIFSRYFQLETQWSGLFSRLVPRLLHETKLFGTADGTIEFPPEGHWVYVWRHSQFGTQSETQNAEFVHVYVIFAGIRFVVCIKNLSCLLGFFSKSFSEPLMEQLNSLQRVNVSMYDAIL